MSDDVVVMYAGKVAETADVKTLFKNPKHPYTQALFRAIPDINVQNQDLTLIEGNVPSPLEFPLGCRFSTRCPLVMKECHTIEPKQTRLGEDHYAACHLLKDATDSKTLK